jgi:hypothetical protein
LNEGWVALGDHKSLLHLLKSLIGQSQAILAHDGWQQMGVKKESRVFFATIGVTILGSRSAS